MSEKKIKTGQFNKAMSDKELEAALEGFKNGASLFEVLQSIPAYKVYLNSVPELDKKIIEDRARNLAEKLDPAIIKFRDEWSKPEVKMAFKEKAVAKGWVSGDDE
jgi:hypothetical protein